MYELRYQKSKNDFELIATYPNRQLVYGMRKRKAVELGLPIGQLVVVHNPVKI